MNEYFDTIEVKRFFKFGGFVLIMLGIFLVAETLGALKSWQTPSAAYSTIVVSGDGEAYANPDIASFSFSVSDDAASVAGAQSAVTKKTDAVLAALKNLSIADNDIRTADYSVYPKYKYVSGVCAQGYCPPSNQVPDGYTVSQTVTVKVRNTDDAGKALAAAGDNGATNISGLNFTLDDPNAPQAEARNKAIADARAKAKALAKSLGVSLGRVVDFSDGQSNPSPYPMYALDSAAGGAAKAPSIPTGQNKVTDHVTVTYEIR